MCTLAYVNGILLSFVGLHKRFSSPFLCLPQQSVTKFDPINKNIPQVFYLSVFVFSIGREG